MPHEILIVDPDKTEVQVTSKLLKEVGYATLWASDVEDAFAILKIRPIAAILANYQLPSGTGVDLLRAIRGEPKYEKLPVLLMTRAASSRIVHEAKLYGASDFIVKPLDASRLRKALAMFIAKGPDSGRLPAVSSDRQTGRQDPVP